MRPIFSCIALVRESSFSETIGSNEDRGILSFTISILYFVAVMLSFIMTNQKISIDY